MKANELRLGNIVDYFGKPKFVKKIETHSAIYIGGADSMNELVNTYNNQDAFEGVELSEDWLLALGFTKTTTNYFELGVADASFDYKISHQFIFFNRHFVPVKDKPLKYVHQLQNLYFSLTGIELICIYENFFSDLR